MTYISIQAEVEKSIRGDCEAGLIRLVEPVIPGSRYRVIYAEAELHTALMDPNDWRMGQLRRDFDRFILGDLIIVGRGHDEDCHIKHLDPPENQVWEIRSRSPKPSLRVFGRFIATDVFIATNYQRRDALRHRRSREFAIEIARCVATWTRLFPDHSAHRGDGINAYISDNVRELTQLP